MPDSSVECFIGQYRDELPALMKDQTAALDAHLALLERWNRTINLTSIKIQNELVRKHIGESLFLGRYLPAGALRICDLGSGGGFPGIPVAIARPDCKVTLVESDIRKGVFLREASRSLNNVSVVSERFESVQGEFDWLISRAVNLYKTYGGPECARAAFLGALGQASDKAKPIRRSASVRSVASRFRWRTVPIPWDSSGVLSLGVQDD